MTTTDTLRGWSQSALPINAGPKPRGTLTLAALATCATQTQLTQQIADAHGLDTRTARLALLHQAAAAISSTLIAPLALDGVRLKASAGQIGLVLTPEAEVSGIWVGRTERLPDWAGSLHVGSTAWSLLYPIGERARRRLEVGVVAMNVLMFEALEMECLRLRRHGAEAGGPDWMEQVLTGTGFIPPTPGRWLTVMPDGGADVVLPIRRVCCAMKTVVATDSCPTCPLRTDTSRTEETSTWLSGIDDAVFQRVTGRARLTDGQLRRRMANPTAMAPISRTMAMTISVAGASPAAGCVAAGSDGAIVGTADDIDGVCVA
jgi:hypothetical protein